MRGWETVSESVNVSMNMEESQAARELLDRSERKQGMCCGSLLFSVFLNNLQCKWHGTTLAGKNEPSDGQR